MNYNTESGLKSKENL